MLNLSIIILSYNTKELTLQCVESIIKQYKRQLEKKSFEVVVVDNNSTDGTVEAIRELRPPKAGPPMAEITNYELRIVSNNQNYGFSKGNNIGGRQAKGKYLIFLNSDTEVRDDGLIGMVDFLDKNEKIGILGAALKNEDGTNQPSAGKFYNLINVFLMLFGGERAGLLRASPQNIRSVDWVSGASMMIRKNLFDKLSGFDENFFMYVEDMELCFRAKKESFLTYFFPNVSIIHKSLGSSNRTFAILSIYKGLLYFYKKHTNYIQYLLVKLMLLAKACIAVTVGIFTNNTYLKSTYKKALSLS